MTNRLASAIDIYVAFAFVGVSTYETSGLCGYSFQLFIATVPLLFCNRSKK
ncbi:hypothetical protein [Fulvivirga ligni]|uniref:hypothetical protein n=1 Tax=Fulvivirga ligni TaxID=2904246 RepID=UPI001F3C2B7F|nr:hypothetical protein [Fulvivirga ligni]UII19856.1 hypothetical protein LVD16_18600 [Fulvivirga ligni]